MNSPSSSSNSGSPLHLALASGGTGGHFYPALATAQEWRRQGGRATFFISGHHAAAHLLAARNEGFESREIRSVRLPKRPWLWPFFPFRFLGAMLDARRAIAAGKPDALLGMGSFASAPVCLAASRAKIPLILHEGNALTGRANRLLSKQATLLAVSFREQANPDAVHCPLLWTGFPLREALLRAAREPQPPLDYLRAAGLTPGRPTLLGFGGSQGARFVNFLILDTLAALDASGRERLQLLHFTGQDDNRELEAAYRAAGLTACVKKSESDMASAYLAADLVVCRSGGSTLAELALFGKPAVLIPLPTAAEDHQTLNARAAIARGGGQLLPQTDPATPARLAAILRAWLGDPDTVRPWGNALRDTLAAPDAAATLVREIRARLTDANPG